MLRNLGLDKRAKLCHGKGAGKEIEAMLNSKCKGMVPDEYIGLLAKIVREHSIRSGWFWIECGGRQFVLPRECVDA